MKKIAIIIPTFNELDNIENLIQAILNNLPESIIFIVDDSKNKEIGNLISSKNMTVSSRKFIYIQDQHKINHFLRFSVN